MVGTTSAILEANQATDINIPESLIYEMVDGKPIYYKGWQEVITGEKTIEQVMASSKIQSLLVAALVGILYNKIRKLFRIATNEAGVKFKKGDWRAADIGLWSRKNPIQLDNKYFEEIPEIIIEVDTKADTESGEQTYITDKTKQLHQNGVKKVIWIFTLTEQVMIAEIGKRWEIADWSEDIEIAFECTINVKEIIEDIKALEGDLS
jgi:Uma2 family endonuclease